MKRLLTYFAFLLIVLASPLIISSNSPVSAVDLFPICNNGNASGTNANGTDACQNITDPSNAGKNPIIDALKLAITIITIIIGFTSVIMIIIGGLTFVTANGDAQAIAKGRRGIVYALVGLVIVALAQTLVVFVLNRL